jgi:hypothetical protein
MAKLKDKIKTGLDEDRMLVLVVQVLLGFECRAAFEPGFERLPPVAQYLKLTSFGLLLLTLAVLLAVPAYHREVEHGESTPHFQRVLGRFMIFALAPFALALGIDVSIAGQKVFGQSGGMSFGLITAAAAAFFWYGFEMYSRRARKNGDEIMKDEESEKTPLSDKIKQILTEGRIVLPGAQALLGFQLSAFLTDGFDKLPRESQVLHLIALSLVALTAIFLMTPPAYHRIVEKGEDTERFHKLASRFVMAAMIPLALGITTDFYVVLNKVTKAPVVALTLSAVALAMFYGLWFAFPLFRARSNGRSALITSPAHQAG